MLYRSVVATIGFIASMGVSASIELFAAEPTDSATTTDFASQALSQQVPANEIRWLDEAQGKYLTLLRENYSGKPLGLAILVPAPGDTANSPRAIADLRHQLNDHGWVTLAITAPPAIATPEHISPLPSGTAPPSPDATNDGTAEAAKPASGGNKSDVVETPANRYEPGYPKEKQQQLVDEYASRMQERINAAQTMSEIYPGASVLLAQGQSAHWLLELLKTEKITPPDALVLLDARPMHGQTQQQLAELIGSTPLPILDLNQAKVNIKHQEEMALRQKLRKKNRLSHYRQHELFGRGQDPRLVKLVKGWFSSRGWK